MNLCDRLNREPTLGRFIRRSYRRCVQLATISTLLTLTALPVAAQANFERGDANDDSEIDLSDAICTLLYLFEASVGPCASPLCLDAHDVNDDGDVDVSDPIRLLTHLFVDGPPLPEPYRSCGEDPTRDKLSCEVSIGCADNVLRFTVANELELVSMWSEPFTTIESRLPVLSKLTLRPGTYALLRGETPGVDLIAALSFGADLQPATPQGPGTFQWDAEAFYPFRYTQTFDADEGELLVTFDYRPEDSGATEALDCAVMDGAFGAPAIGLLRIERLSLPEEDRQRLVFYTCVFADIWSPTFPRPYALDMADGTHVDLLLLDTFLGRGVAGETGNRHFDAATVEFRGQTLEIVAYEQLVLAGWHHNASQEFRIVFDAPVDDVHGLEIVECPPPNEFPTFCWRPPTTLAYYLDADLQRADVFSVTWVEPAPESGSKD